MKKAKKFVKNFVKVYENEYKEKVKSKEQILLLRQIMAEKLLMEVCPKKVRKWVKKYR